MRPRVTKLTAVLAVVLLWTVTGYWEHQTPLGHLAHVQPALAAIVEALQTFTGSPPVPTSWSSADMDVTVHSRDIGTWQSLEPMRAGHGSDCAPPPTTHAISQYEQAVFQCRDHIMTAINAGGYGVVYLTPNDLVDFSGGEAVVRFDVSTARTSSRDWIDLWVSPYEDHLQLPLDNWLPDLSGEPVRSVHLRMDSSSAQSIFRASVIRKFATEDISGNWWTGYESVLTPSATQRETFELRLSRTHIKFWMPAYNLVWIDADVADLGWTSGVVQLGHHSYTPTKDCPSGQTCTPNTWHWDNVSISPAVPFTIIQADRRFVDQTTGSTSINFTAPAPAGAHLRFAAQSGTTPQISLDRGQTWQAARLQPAAAPGADHVKSYFTPIPAGTQRVEVRGTGGYWGSQWIARDFSIWAGAPSPITPGTTPTVTPSDHARPPTHITSGPSRIRKG
jgi:hypothetical protein